MPVFKRSQLKSGITLPFAVASARVCIYDVSHERERFYPFNKQ